jgi:hypothetical protein
MSVNGGIPPAKPERSSRSSSCVRSVPTATATTASSPQASAHVDWYCERKSAFTGWPYICGLWSYWVLFLCSQLMLIYYHGIGFFAVSTHIDTVPNVWRMVMFAYFSCFINLCSFGGPQRRDHKIKSNQIKSQVQTKNKLSLPRAGEEGIRTRD